MTVKVFVRCVWVSLVTAILAIFSTSIIFVASEENTAVVSYEEIRMQKPQSQDFDLAAAPISEISTRRLSGWEKIKTIFSSPDYVANYFQSALKIFIWIFLATIIVSYLNTRKRS